MESVYLETSFISYLVFRPSRDLLVTTHQQLSQEWWLRQRLKFECYVSQIVIEEVSAGNQEQSKKRMKIVTNLPVLTLTVESEKLTRAIIASNIIPSKAIRDAAHIAVSTVHRIDYLLTWNCRHLANAQIMRRMEAICNNEGYNMPLICTAEELMGV